MDSTPVLSDAVISVLRLAAGRQPAGLPLSTAAVFAALPDVDHRASWERLWLHTGEPRALDLAHYPDDDSRAATHWENISVTAELADALAFLESVRRAYDLPPASTGLLAVALVAAPGCGATRGLTRHGLTPDALLELVQSEILGTTLEALPALTAREDPKAPPEPVPEPVPESVPESVPEAVQGGSGRRRAAWIALSVVSLLGIGLAIRTSPGFNAAPPPAPEVPFRPPALASRMLTTADVTSALGTDMIALQDRPPDSKMWTSNGPLVADTRNAAIVAGWQREWVSTDQARYVLLRSVEVTRPRYHRMFHENCGIETPVPVPAALAAASAGFVDKGDNHAAFCMLSEKGNIGILVSVRMRGASAAEMVPQVAQRLMTRQLSLVGGYVPAPPVVNSQHYAKASIDRWLLLTALILPLVLALPLALVDRATWRRLRRRFRRREAGDPYLVSVDPAARLALSESTALTLFKLAVYVWLLRWIEALPIGLYATAALLLAAFCLMTVAESRILHGTRGRYTPRPFRGLSRLFAVGGLVVTAAFVAGAFLIAGVSLAYAGLGLNPAGPDYQIARIASLGIVAALAVLAGAVIPLMFVRRLAMRRVSQEAQSSPGRHIVLLRSFADDKRRVRARRLDRASIVDRICLRRWERFEEIIATALSTIGPVIALSRPGERLPPALGAVRQQFPMDGWRAGVRDLIRDSALVCMVVGRTESLVIELREVQALGALHKALFLVPPCGRREQRRRLALLSRELGIPWDRMLRATRGTDVLLIMQNAGPERAVIFTARAPDDVGYEAAVHAAVLLTGQPAPATAVVREIMAGFRHRAAGDRPVPSAGPTPPPAVEVYAPGRAPVYVPVYRRWTVMPWLLSSVLTAVVLLVTTFVTGINTHDFPVVTTGQGTATWLAEDDVTGELYAVIDRFGIVKVDPAEKEVKLLGTSNDAVDDLIVHDGVAYGESPVTGVVTAVSLSTHRPLWTARLLPGLRGLALAGDLLVTTVPGRREVIAVSARDGRQVGKRTVAGIPWGVTVSGDRFVVPLVDRGKIVSLSTRDLTPAGTVATVTGPQQVVAQGPVLWVLAPTQDRVVRHQSGTVAPGGQLLLSDPGALVAASNGWFAVQGHERVTLVSATGLLVRVPLPYTGVTSMCVTRAGHLFVGVEGSVAQLH
ncbi:hypothetical protein GCM10010435_23390 [Winogradskya consettensis]|uniref:Uncharacterized protein n=1 Tax=Winogradskya consettensis TaxID=113560 RepID=A0A919SPP1_9ACTN|nr:hypothetical protein [Actinoplanes consettensis]GIM75381.1 hypothetical protein Aco04nite_45100 [Actinoplanes consettensis]